MRKNALFIAALLMALIAAPVVDAIVCDGCKDSISRRYVPQSITTGVDHPECSVSSSDACASGSHGTSTAPDLCPICSGVSAAKDNTYCGTPSLISETNHLSKLLAFSGPSSSITKPPES